MNDEQLLRYSRQIMLPELDYDGQQRLLAAKVLIVGMGGLGSPVAMYLAAAGVGELWLADFDRVELSNLQRQIAHGEADIGRLKVSSVANTVKSLNSGTQVEQIVDKLDGDLLHEAVSRVDLVVDASDNFATRFALNRACVAQQKPLVSGAAIRMEGQVISFDSRQLSSPCYRCLYDDAATDSQLSCSESGVLAPVVGVIGSLQATAALQMLAQVGEPPIGSLLLFDAKTLGFKRFSVPKDPACPVCQA
jgi:adenylyltransferase/sulfurtransferase